MTIIYLLSGTSFFLVGLSLYSYFPEAVIGKFKYLSNKRKHILRITGIIFILIGLVFFYQYGRATKIMEQPGIMQYAKDKLGIN